MNLLRSAQIPSHARWDGSRVLFDIVHDRRGFPCAISRAALEEIGARRLGGAAELLRVFERARGVIEGLALSKLQARPAGVSGRLSLWADDLGDPAPPVGVEATRPRQPLMSACA